MKKYEEPILDTISFEVENIMVTSPDTLQDYLQRNDMASEDPGNIRSFEFGDL